MIYRCHIPVKDKDYKKGIISDQGAVIMKKKISVLLMSILLTAFCSTAFMREAAYAADQGARYAANVLKLMEADDEFEVTSVDKDLNGYYIQGAAKNNSARAADFTGALDEDGHLLYIYFYDERVTTDISSTKEKMRKAAESLIYKLIPGSEGHVIEYDTKYDTEDPENRYLYCYHRVENGYEVSSNFVDIEINRETGLLSSINIEWDHDATFPAPKIKVSEEQAWQRLTDKAGLKLRYRLGGTLSWDPDIDDYVYNEKIYLAYLPTFESVIIDAKDATTAAQLSYLAYDELLLSDDFGDGINFGKEITLTRVNKTVSKNGLLSAKQARKKVLSNKYLLTDKSFTEGSEKLRRADNGKYYWVISRNDGTAEAEKYFTAILNAKTGELKYFYSNLCKDEGTADELKYSRKKCRKIMNKFLKKAASGKYSDVTLCSDDFLENFKDTETGNMLTGSYVFEYSRLINGIEYNFNGMRGEVDRVSGKLRYYFSHWDDLEAPEPVNVVKPEEALKSMYYSTGSNPVYMIDTKTGKDGSVKKTGRLVYLYRVNTGIVDAFTGKMLDAGGNEW